MENIRGTLLANGGAAWPAPLPSRISARNARPRVIPMRDDGAHGPLLEDTGARSRLEGTPGIPPIAPDRTARARRLTRRAAAKAA